MGTSGWGEWRRRPITQSIASRTPDETGTFNAGILRPSQWFVLEVLVARSIRWPESPETAACRRLPGVPHRYHWSEMPRLPMTESAQSGLEAGLPEEFDDIRTQGRPIPRGGIASFARGHRTRSSSSDRPEGI